jgi:glutamate--cysteine ligase catalytic subunit
MKIAHKRDAVLNEKFWFRKNVFRSERNNVMNNDELDSTSTHQPNGNICDDSSDEKPASIEDEYEQMSIDEVINGNCDNFPGLMTLINRYLESLNIDVESRCMLGEYLKLVKKKAKGEIQTTAKWMREFVRSHPKYQQDSVVTQEINYDLMKMIEKIQKGEAKVPELLGDFAV